MRFATIRSNGQTGFAVSRETGLFALFPNMPHYPGRLEDLVSVSAAELRSIHDDVVRHGRKVDAAEVEFLPPLARPPKIVCVGLNYVDHTAESGFAQPAYPTLFARYSSSLCGHGQDLVRPTLSEQFDFEGEVAVILGAGGRNISRENALGHVFGYSLFNDASVRDFQFKSPQWTAGKNFDATGAFGPFVVTADEVPPGCKGMTLETRLNGQVVQRAPIDDMVFDVATLIEILSQFMTLEAGDVIVSGTPAGVGMARKPPLWMKAGDVVEVHVAGLGTLSNVVVGG
ncbi:MAG: fumarylacetoacetate hydrolase family protein [Pseudomonadota bacterium]